MKKKWTYRLRKLKYSYGWRRWYRLMSRDRTPPCPVRNLSIALNKVIKLWCHVEGEYMKKARVTVVWDLSVSDDVELQELVVTVGGEEVAAESLPFSVNEYVVPTLFDEGATLHVEITVVDYAGNRSDVTAGDLSIPDFTAPAPVGEITFNVEVIDVE